MDISTDLIAALQGSPYASSVVIVVGVIGYLLTHVFPVLPKPVAPGVWSSTYAVLSFLAGNWGGAKNTVAVPVAVPVAVVAPSEPIEPVVMK